MRGYTYILILITGLLLSCSKVTEDYREKQAQALYRESLQLYEEGEYDDAIIKFKEALKYIDYLSPEQIRDIKYKMAISYYKKEDYINIESYLNVAPDAFRDQTYTEKAVEKAKEFLIKFPKSNYTEKVKNIMKKALQKIAKHEYLIARFYEDYGYYYSAARRYKDLLINSYEYIDEEEVAFRYIKNLFMTRRQERWKSIYEKARDEANKAMEKYAEIYGKNKYYKELLKWKNSSL